jgi:hypothetical protein
MDNQPQDNSTPDNPPQANQNPPARADYREQKREYRATRRAERREARLSGGWVAGAILVVIGVLLLLQTTGIANFNLTNWWALFILIPAIGALSSGVGMYQNAGNQLTAPAVGSFVIGVVLFLVSMGFLFNLNWTYLGPALLILAGVALLLTTLIPRRKE